MAYAPRTWSDGTTPYLSAANLNAMEAGIVAAIGGVFNVKDYGATGDGSTDDAPAIQALFDLIQSAPVSSGVIGATVVFPPGEYVISSTLTLDQWAGSIVGTGGMGNSPAYSTDAGHASVIRWNGSAGSPMLQFSDSRTLLVENLRFEGKDGAAPSYGINFSSTTGQGAGTNGNITIRRCWIGDGTWSSQGVNVGAITTGIGFTGDNVNNDQFAIENCVFNATPTGFYAPNSQSIWGVLSNCYFNTCTTAGVQTNASTTMVNATFNACEIDVKVTGTPRVLVFGWWSENSSLIYDLAEGASLIVNGGKWQVMSSMTGNSYINAANLVANDLTIRDVYVDYDITAIPLYARGGYAAAPYRIAVSGCKGFTEALLDVRGYGAAGTTFVDIHTNDVDVSTTLTNKALATYIEPQTKTGIYTLVDGESAPIINNYSAGAITLPDATTCRPGATRFTVKNIHANACTVKSNGGTVDEAAAATGITLAQWESADFVTDGTNWFSLYRNV